jgi:hypothetical protein
MFRWSVRIFGSYGASLCVMVEYHKQVAPRALGSGDLLARIPA